MVMTPEPFGEAFDALGIDGATVVVPTPSGAPFSQTLARELADAQRLVFLCGRYEGIDQRVLDHAATRAEVVEVSLGDYVLNGGEVAAVAVTEAVVRLLPGFMGNAASLVEESHEDGLLEYPVYTRPASWRGLDVPAGAAVRRPRRDRGLAARAGPAPYGASAGPTCCTRASRPTEWEIVRRAAGRRRRAADPAAGVLGAGGAGQRQPRRHPGAARVARRRAGLDGHLVDLGGPQRGPAGRRRTRPPRGHAGRPGLGHRPHHGRPRPPGPRARPGPARPHRGGRGPRGDVVPPVHRCPQRRQHPDVQEGRLPGAHRPRGAAARGDPDQATPRELRPRPRARSLAASPSSGPRPIRGALLARRLAPRPSRPKDRSEQIVPGRSASGSCHRGVRRRRPPSAATNSMHTFRFRG